MTIKLIFVFVFSYVQHIICEFFLGDNKLLFAIDDKIAAVVITTLSHIKTNRRVKSVQNTQLGLKHNWKTS